MFYCKIFSSHDSHCDLSQSQKYGSISRERRYEKEIVEVFSRKVSKFFFGGVCIPIHALHFIFRKFY